MKWNNIFKTSLLSLILIGCSPYQEQQTKKSEETKIRSIYSNVMNNQLIPEITDESEIKKHKIMHLQSSNKVYEIQVFETKENVKEVWITYGHSKKEMLSFTDTGLDGIVDKAYTYKPSKKEDLSGELIEVTYSISPLSNPKEHQETYSLAIKELSDLLKIKN